MSKHEIPRNSKGERVCQFCHEHPVRESLGTKPVIYCSAACKQAAYAARKLRKAIEAAVALERRAAKSATLNAQRRPDDLAKSETLPGNVSDFAEGSAEVSTQTSLTLPTVPAPSQPAPAIPAPAGAEVELPKVSRRRSAITASAMPLPVADGARPGIDPGGWRRAVEAYDERQGSLFEDQGDEVPAPRGE